ncbi:MAG: serine hydrolase, partial [Brevundimonas sp.]
MRLLILAAAAAFALPAVAQTPAPAPSAATRAMAAGYKALTVCSAVLNARAAGAERTVESVEANELVGIYPELDALVRELPVEVWNGAASVRWDEAMPPRIAVYGDNGCSIMPVGWRGDAAESGHLAPGALREEVVEASSREGRDALDTVIRRVAAQDYGEGTRTTAVVVLNNGLQVAEWYAPGFGPYTPQRTWSVGKSIAGTLIGAAVQRGEADVNAPAAIADWSRDGDPRATITLDQLMRMASGLT